MSEFVFDPADDEFQDALELISEQTELVTAGLLNLPDSGQDRVFTRQGLRMPSGELVDIIAVFDGHGHAATPDKPHYVDALTAIPTNAMDALWTAESPLDALVQYFEQLHPNSYCQCTGAVASMARIHADHVETFCIGDASVLVFLDGYLLYMNRAHTGENPKEVRRLIERFGVEGFRICGTQAFTVENDTTVTAQGGSMTKIFAAGTKTVLRCIAPTQALGHGGLTGYHVCKRTIALVPGQNVHIVVCSDGVTNVMARGLNMREMENPSVQADLKRLSETNGIEIAHWARSRWSQEWNVALDGVHVGKRQFAYNRKEQDDVSAVTWTRFVVPPPPESYKQREPVKCIWKLETENK